MKSLSALIGGILFGLGLAVSGMADPQIVLAFLTLDSGWNPALIGVMGAGVVTTFIGYRLILRRQQPLNESHFDVPTNRQIDKRLIGGAAIFGVGWGVTGYCPGPAIVGAFALDTRALIFTAAFVVGVLVYEFLQRSRDPGAVVTPDS